MSEFNKAKVPVAINKKHKFDMSKQHLATHNFMEFFPSYSQIIVPNSHIKIRPKTFVRCLPLDNPCLGSVSIHNRYFFVPFPYIWESFRNFKTDTPKVTETANELLQIVPTISLHDIYSVFTDVQYGLCEQSSLSNPYDFRYYSSVVGGFDNYSKLNALGKRFYKVFTSLGIVLRPSMDQLNAAQNYISALPLLSVVKVYMDWYYPSAYSNYGEYAWVQGFFNRRSSYELYADDLARIARVIAYVGYSDDFFTSVWDNPTAPNSGVGSNNYIISDVTAPGAGSGGANAQNVSQYTNGTPYIFGAPSSTVKATQYSIDSLKALTNFLHRNQVVGSRVVDRWLAAYGVQLSNAEIRRSFYLGEDSFPLEIGDVMSHSDTNGASLGSYAGKGIAYSGANKVFEFESDDFGMVLGFTTFVPDVDYPFGIDKTNRMLTKLDYLTGEFDGLGPEVVMASEIDNSALDNDTRDSIFGFAPRYYGFKVPRSRVSGGFISRSDSLIMQGWSTVRKLYPQISFGEITTNPIHNLDFVLGRDADQYNRIFLGYIENHKIGNSDGFIAVHRQDVEYYAPMKPLYDNYDFDEENKDEITFEPNGIKMN